MKALHAAVFLVLATAGASAFAAEPAATSQGLLRLDWMETPTLSSDKWTPQMVVFSAPNGDFPTRCNQLRAARVAELGARWRAAIQPPTVDKCTVASPGGPEESPFLEYIASARFKPGSVSLQGIPVLQVLNEMGPIYGNVTYTLDMPYTQASKSLQPMILQNCRKSLKEAVEKQRFCTVEQDEGGESEGWSVAIGEPNATIYVNADPHNSARSLYKQSWGD